MCSVGNAWGREIKGRERLSLREISHTHTDIRGKNKQKSGTQGTPRSRTRRLHSSPLLSSHARHHGACEDTIGTSWLLSTHAQGGPSFWCSPRLPRTPPPPLAGPSSPCCLGDQRGRCYRCHAARGHHLVPCARHSRRFEGLALVGARSHACTTSARRLAGVYPAVQNVWLSGGTVDPPLQSTESVM